jgi:hypothetical protein
MKIEKKKQEKTVAIAGEETKKGATAATPARITGESRPSTVTVTTRKGPTQTLKTATLPRTHRTSAVTVTLSEGTRMSYADVLATARQRIPLTEIGVESVEMRKVMTCAIVIRVPGDRDRGKASRLAARLTEVLDPTAVRVAAPTKTEELRVVGIDISVDKEEFRRALASAMGCSSAEVQVGEIGASRGGLESAWIKCPVVGAWKLAREGKMALGWSRAKIIAIPTRSLQCHKCLELGHVRAACVSAVDRGHLCHRCGESGHRARTYPAATPKCPLC